MPDDLVERLNNAAVATLELYHVYLGERLGLYRVLGAAGPLTSDELAARAGIHERYAREWLEQQAVAGILHAESAKYSLPREHAEALVDADSVNFLAPLGQAVVGIGGVMPKVVEAFRTGAGVPYEAYGADMRGAISALNRPAFLSLLGSEWFPAVPDLDARLRAAPPARVADVGCGTGWSSIAIALAYPSVHVEGIDIDQASILEARRNALAGGVADRVTFEARDAADPNLAGLFDVVTAFETIHDMAHPVDALRAMLGLARATGHVIVMDEKVPDQLSAPGDDIARFHHAWSAVHCLPVGMGEPGSAGTGSVMRTSTLRRYAREAGFTDVEVLPIGHESWRFYRLVLPRA